MRTLTFITLAFGLAGCAGQVATGADLTPPAPEEFIEGAQVSYGSCILAAARRLDDDSQRPIGLALRIMPLCEMEFTSLEAISTAEGNRFQRYAIRNGLEQKKLDFVVGVVLRERRERIFGP